MTCRTRSFRRPDRAGRARRGFTLPELLVAMLAALIMMSIVGGALSLAGGMVSESRAKGKMTDQQRMAMSVMAFDLRLPHFLEDGKPNGRQRVSDQRTDLAVEYKDTSTGKAMWRGYTPPRAGYFFAYSAPVDGSNHFDEGADTDGFRSSRSNHAIQFTAIVPGGAPQDTLTADVPFMNSPKSASYPLTFHAAELAYFLRPNGFQTPGGLKLYDLIRRQRCCALNQYDAAEYSKIVNAIPTTGTSAMAKTDPPEVIATVDRNTTGSGPANFEVFDLGKLTLAANRGPRTAITSHRIGDDVLLSNVTSLEFKFTGSSSIGWPRLPLAGNTDYPFDTLPLIGSNSTYTYDTFTTLQGDWNEAQYLAGSSKDTGVAPVKPIRLTRVLIRIRCWDPKSKTSKQTSLEVDL